MIKLSTNSKLNIKIKIQQVNDWIHSDFDPDEKNKFQHISSYNNSCYVWISIIISQIYITVLLWFHQKAAVLQSNLLLENTEAVDHLVRKSRIWYGFQFECYTLIMT
ncbi:Hypothetical_protein [Hexamita inflata]|uniref:Hypothetical_protein n=1 Tax=Hexamita inflata TaxID=28002 RepID=A0ABP1JIS3_9EUKA